MAERYELHEWQWQLIRDLFPPPKATGRKRRDLRQMFNAIFWILCGGAPWRDLPERYGPWERAGATGSRHLVCRFHDRQGLPSRGRSEKGGCEALGRSRGGFSTKLHLVCDGLGNPLAVLLTPGQQQESTVCAELLASVRVRTSAGGGRPRSRPKLVVADRGYDAGAFQRHLRRRGIRCVIPEKRVPAGKRRRRRGRPPTFCRATYRQRNVVERMVGWLKEHRRIATRFEKLASSFLAMVKLSFMRRYFRMLERFSDRT
jgi:transposase